MPIATLLQLRKLSVDLEIETYFSWTDFLALHNLTELHELSIENGICESVAHADVAALFLQLRYLRQLSFMTSMECLPPSALHAVDEARPQLCDLMLTGD